VRGHRATTCACARTRKHRENVALVPPANSVPPPPLRPPPRARPRTPHTHLGTTPRSGSHSLYFHRRPSRATPTPTRAPDGFSRLSPFTKAEFGRSVQWVLRDADPSSTLHVDLCVCVAACRAAPTSFSLLVADGSGPPGTGPPGAVPPPVLAK
jgi:hypothetical protein